MRSLVGVVVMVVLGCAVQVAAQAPTAENFDRWASFITPASEELAWRAIPWRTTLEQGILDAQTENKPILLWAMNGHPMGCT